MTAGYKDYRSVTEFAAHPEQLSREALEATYLDLRSTYKSLVLSRGQLVRRQTEAKAKIADLNQSSQRLQAALQKVNEEKQKLQASLAHNTQLRSQLEAWGNELTAQVDDLQAKMDATTHLLGEFEAVYEEVQADSGFLSVGRRLLRLLQAAHKLLNTDVSTLLPQRRITTPPEDWTQEDPRSLGRSLRDGN